MLNCSLTVRSWRWTGLLAAFEYNVKHYVLSQKQWYARAYLTFMSRPEQGHIRVVHFNRDKPWAGAQCGPFHHAFWHAANRTVSALSPAHARMLSVGGERGLTAFIREGMRHEDARPCVRGAKTELVYVPTLTLEKQGFTEHRSGREQHHFRQGVARGGQRGREKRPRRLRNTTFDRGAHEGGREGEREAH